MKKLFAKDCNIAWLSTHPNGNTGYSIQTRETIGCLIQRRFNITAIAGGGRTEWSPNHKHTIVLSDGSEEEITVLPTVGDGSGIGQWAHYKESRHIELLITLWDYFMIAPYTAWHEEVDGIHQIPVDAPFTEEMFEAIKFANHIVAMSKYGYSELIKWFPPNRVSYIPHGIDCNLYHPYVTERITELRKEKGLTDKDFLFINVSVNAGTRKRIPNLLKSFAALLKRAKNPEHIFLYLFTNYQAHYNIGFNLTAICREYGISGNIFVPDRDIFLDPVSQEEMIDLYNMADCYVSTSQGEGFGLTVQESLACGVPVIAPNNSTMPELLDNGLNGWLVDTIDKEMTSDFMARLPSGQDFELVNEKALVEKMLYVIDHAEERQEKGRNGRAFIAKTYPWDNIIDSWENLIINILEDNIVRNEIKISWVESQNQGQDHITHLFNLSKLFRGSLH